jgi:hypothetical protein
MQFRRDDEAEKVFSSRAIKSCAFGRLIPPPINEWMMLKSNKKHGEQQHGASFNGQCYLHGAQVVKGCVVIKITTRLLSSLAARGALSLCQ